MHTAVTALGYSELDIYLLFPLNLILSYIFMLLLGVLSFQPEVLPLVFLIRQTGGDECLCFCYPGNVFISLSPLKDSSPGLGFSVSILNIPFIRAFKVSVKKSAICFGGISLYVMSCFSLDAFKFLSLTLNVLITMCLWVILGFILLGSFGLPIPGYPRFGKFSAIISWKKLYI